MFMSTRYKKKDPEWRKKSLFNVENSLAKLMEYLSVEYSVGKLISPKWKNFRSQKLKFESKTRINNAIWRCWHIQYKETRRPRFFKFDMPFSDQTVHSTPQAVILEGKTWKKRLDLVSREYKKWRKFYNYKILKGGGEETDNLKQQLSNENSEDEFSSDEDEDHSGKKSRQSPKKIQDHKSPVPNQKLFESKAASDFMLDTFLADLPDTLFSSIRPVRSAADNALGLTYTDSSDMFQPTLDQLNPCFDELLQNFDFFTSDWGNLQNNTRTIESPVQSNLLQPDLINSASIYNDTLETPGEYLYSSDVLYTPNPSASIEKPGTSIDSLTPMLAKDTADEGLQFTMSSALRKDESRKRPLDDTVDVNVAPTPMKIVLKEVDKTSQFLNENYLQKGQTDSHLALTDGKTDYVARPSNFEALLSNAIDMSANQNAAAEQVKSLEGIRARDMSSASVESRGMSIDTVEEIISVESQVSQRKMLVNQMATTKVVEYSELPPQLQAPNLTAHLQAVMSTRNVNPMIPRNKSDTQLSSLADTFASPQNLKLSKRETSLARGRRVNRSLPRNRSDTNLVQMAKDTCTVYTRRRLASFSVDTKPLSLPRNFSDSNLCSLGRSMPRRPQPILPKNLIGIVPPQVRPSGAITKVAISQVDTISAQTSAAVSGQRTSFFVNKQQPTSTDPVQVTLYMPKVKKANQLSVTPNEDTAVALPSSTLPQRVEVIQYKGQNSNEQGNKTVGLVPAVAIAPTVNQVKTKPPSGTQLSVPSVATHKDIAGTTEQATYVIQHETLISSKEPLSVPPSCQSGTPHSSISSTIPVAGLSVPSVIQKIAGYDVRKSAQNPGGNIEASALPAVAAPTPTTEPPQVPIVAASSDNTESIAPLQGLSDQQLVSLAKILRGSRAGDIGQETTIAYLEMLQKQLNTLLEQQQGKVKGHQDAPVDVLAASINTGSKIHTVVGSDILADATLPLASVTQSSVTLTCAPVLSATLTAATLSSAALPTSILVPVSHLGSSHHPKATSDQKALAKSSNMPPKSAEGVMVVDTRASIHGLPTSLHTVAAHMNSSHIKQSAASQIFIPTNTNANEALFAKISDAPSGGTAPLLCVDVAPDMFQQRPVNQGSRSSCYTASTHQPTQQRSLQQPILIELPSSVHQSTIDASMIQLPVASTQGGPSLVAVSGVGGGDMQASGTSVRPTMVDLAIAASQRTYLTDDPSILVGPGDTGAVGSRPETMNIRSTNVSCIAQSVPTVVISDVSPDKGNDAAGAKRSRLRFQDREMYKEYRRKNHVTAEQKRRGLIKVAFDQMISLIPSLQEDRHGRTSKALVLQKAAEYIDHLQREKELTKYKIEKMRREVNRLNEEIKICQAKLPACGAISEQPNTRDAKTSYMEHVRQRIVKDSKYWLFSVMLRPLFESFNESTATKTLQEFIHSVLKWFEDNCSLTVLRPAVIASLRQISTDTAILSNPAALPEQALQAARCQDPTVLGQQQTLHLAESSTQVRPATALQAATTTPSVVGVPNTVIVASQPVRVAVHPQQLHQQEFTHSRQSYITWSTQPPPH